MAANDSFMSERVHSSSGMTASVAFFALARSGVAHAMPWPMTNASTTCDAGMASFAILCVARVH